MPIHLLPDEVASQIAAGEVVERPASVVKELLENAVDAGARQISIGVEGAGKRSIEVTDDGCGIQVEELSLAVARHATSKLNSAEDLFQIRTLGFRGEALASIGSVSRLTLTSRSSASAAGARLVVEAGRIGALEPVGSPIGTIVRVEDLFFNVPARLKFLKQDATERQQIDNLVTRYAMAYPQVRVRLSQDGRLSLQTSGSGDRREILASLYGVETARQLLEVTADEDGLRLAGFISPISLTRSNRREITFFVNGRWVLDIPLTTALLQAYHTLLMVGRYPLAMLFLELPPEDVDVNVHPAKAEVRFRSPDRMFSAVQRAVRRTLLAYTPIPQVYGPVSWGNSPAPESPDPAWEMPGEAAQDQLAGSQPDSGAAGGAQGLPAQPSLPGGHLPLLRLVGQVGAAYLVAEGPDGLYLIDQHAAHERVLFERFLAERAQPIPAQALLEPAVIQLAPQAAQLLENQLPCPEPAGIPGRAFWPGIFPGAGHPGGDPGKRPGCRGTGAGRGF